MSDSKAQVDEVSSSTDDVKKADQPVKVDPKQLQCMVKYTVSVLVGSETADFNLVLPFIYRPTSSFALQTLLMHPEMGLLLNSKQISAIKLDYL